MNRVLTLSVAAIAGVIVVGLIVWAVVSRPPTDYAADSPEWTFQRYHAAWREHDLDTAYGYFSARVQQGMSLERYRSVVANVYGYHHGEPAGQRTILRRSDVRGDRATLELAVEHRGGGMFGWGNWTYTTQVPMVREGGGWRIDQAMGGIEPLEQWMYDEAFPPVR